MVDLKSRTTSIFVYKTMNIALVKDHFLVVMIYWYCRRRVMDHLDFFHLAIFFTTEVVRIHSICLFALDFLFR